MSTRIRSKCPRCAQTLKVSGSLFGRNVRCPACAHQFVLATISGDDGDTAVKSVDAELISHDSQDATIVTERSRYRADSEPTIGKIAHFELKGVLGHGGFGRVYRAYDPRLDRQVALKVPKFDPEEKRKIRRFLTEARAAAGLRHPNIVAIFDSGLAEGEYFIASEYVDGQTLSKCIESARPEPQIAAGWVRDIALALSYAHEEGIIHRDIKPDNIMIGPSGRPQILDFGLAKRLDDDSSMTVEGGLLGTPAYMSPEQARGETQTVGPKSDQYSLGAVFYELLTGKKPFDGPPHSVISKVTSEEPPSPHSLNSTVPSDLEAICLKAMEKDPPRRYPNLVAMADDLDRWLSGRETVARPISRGERILRWCKKNPLVAGMTAALGAVLCLGTAISTYYAISASHERDVAEAAEREANTQRAAAETQAARAEQGELITRRNLYAAQMNLAQVAADKGNSARVIELLESQRPKSNEEDLRGFEWYHLWRVCFESQGLTIPIPKARINALKYSPDGTILAVGAGGGNLQLRDAATGALRAKLVGHRGGIWSIAFSRDGKTLFSASEDGLVLDWDLATQKVLKKFEGKGGAVRGVALAPDEKMIAATGWDAKHTKIWDMESGAERATLTGPGSGVDVAFSKDGRWLITSGRDGKIRISSWNGTAAEERHTFVANASSVRFALAPDDRSLYVPGKTPAIWNIETGEKISSYPDQGVESFAIALSADGKMVAFGNQDRNVVLWNGKERLLPVHPHWGAVHSAAFSLDGLTLATGGEDATVRLWKVPAAKEPTTIRSGGVTSAVFSPDGKSIASGGYDKFIQFWDATTGRNVTKLSGHSGAVTCVVFSPDGKLVASGGRDALVKLWDVETQKEIATLDQGADQQIWCLAFSPDGRWLATGSYVPDHPADQNQIQLWDVATHNKLATFPGPYRWVQSLAFSPDGRTLASGHQFGTIKLWNASTRQMLRELQGFTGGYHGVSSLVYSPDGETLASSSVEGTINLWNAASGALQSELKGSTAGVSCIRFLHDGRTLASTARDGTLKLWDLASAQERATFQAHSREAQSLDVSHDDSALLTTGTDGTIKIWRTSTDPAAKAFRQEPKLVEAGGQTRADSGKQSKSPEDR